MRLQSVSKPLLLVCLLLAAAPAWSQMTPTRRTTSDGRPLASSLPQQHRSGVHALAFSELNQHLGDFVQVTTIYGDKREGQLDSVKGKSLNIKKAAGLGYAIQNIEFSQIREVLSFR